MTWPVISTSNISMKSKAADSQMSGVQNWQRKQPRSSHRTVSPSSAVSYLVLPHFILTVKCASDSSFHILWVETIRIWIFKSWMFMAVGWYDKRILSLKKKKSKLKVLQVRRKELSERNTHWKRRDNCPRVSWPLMNTSHF